MKGSIDIVPVLSSPGHVYSHLWFIRCEQLHEWVRLPLLPPAMKLRQGNVFTQVGDSVHRRGEVGLRLSVRETLLDREPPPQTETRPGQRPPWTETPPRTQNHPVRAETPHIDRDPSDRNLPPPPLYGNERNVRILLEYILVEFFNPCKSVNVLT